RRPDPARRLLREERGFEEGPEERGEEHHLGGDEERHAVAQPDLHYRVMMALDMRLPDHVAPPEEHRPEHGEHAEDEKPPCPRVHVEEAAGSEQARGDRADQRPRARIDQMVGMLLSLRVRIGHVLALTPAWPGRTCRPWHGTLCSSA